jgi:hypothetical protein
LRESNAAAANECHQLVRPLHPLDLCLVDQHSGAPFRFRRLPKKLSRVFC